MHKGFASLVLLAGILVILISVSGAYLISRNERSEAINEFSESTTPARLKVGNEQYCNYFNMSLAEKSIEKCEGISKGRLVGDIMLSVEQSIESCKHNSAILIGDTTYCSTFSSDFTGTKASDTYFSCISDIARAQNDPSFCDLLEDKQLTENRSIEGCKTGSSRKYQEFHGCVIK